MIARTLSDLEKQIGRRPPEGGWRGLFDVGSSEWNGTSLPEKVEFIRSLPISMYDLVRLFVKSWMPSSKRYVIEDMPMGLSQFPDDLRINKEEWADILNEVGLAMKDEFDWWQGKPQPKHRSIDAGWLS